MYGCTHSYPYLQPLISNLPHNVSLVTSLFVMNIIYVKYPINRGLLCNRYIPIYEIQSIVPFLLLSYMHIIYMLIGRCFTTRYQHETLIV